jgi:hypothetical protein
MLCLSLESVQKLGSIHYLPYLLLDLPTQAAA